VPAGRYSVWLVPAQTPPWTLYLHWEPRLYHLQRPATFEMFRAIPVTPAEGPPTDLLTFSFPETRRAGATLVLQWGTTKVSVDLDVNSTALARRKMTESEAAPYIGEYLGWVYGEKGDSIKMEQRLVFEDGRLKGTIANSTRSFELIPIGERQFLFELRDDDGPFDVELDGPIIFTVDGTGRVTGYWMRGIEQARWMRAVRTR
jgi:hypothetical protein